MVVVVVVVVVIVIIVIKETVDVSSNAPFTMIPFKLNIYLKRYPASFLLKRLNFVNNVSLDKPQLSDYQIAETRIFSSIFFRQKFKGYRCESVMSLFKLNDYFKT